MQKNNNLEINNKSRGRGFVPSLLLMSGILLQGCGVKNTLQDETRFESEITPDSLNNNNNLDISLEDSVIVDSSKNIDYEKEENKKNVGTIKPIQETDSYSKVSLEIVPAPKTDDLYTIETDYLSSYHNIESNTVWYGDMPHQKYVHYKSLIDYHTKKMKSAESVKSNPLVVFAYGGGFVGGDIDALKSASPGILALVDHGFDIAAIDYRKANIGETFPAAYEDAIDALSIIVENFPDSDVVLAGVSAGGTLAYILGTPNLQIQGINKSSIEKLNAIHKKGVIKSVIASNPPTTENWRNIMTFMPGMTPAQMRSSMPVGLAEQGKCPSNIYLLISSFDPETPPQSEALPLIAAIIDNCEHSAIMLDPTDLFHGMTFWPVGKNHPLGDGKLGRATNYKAMLSFISESLEK